MTGRLHPRHSDVAPDDGLSTEAGMVLYALSDGTVQRVIGLVMGLATVDVARAVDEIRHLFPAGTERMR